MSLVSSLRTACIPSFALALVLAAPSAATAGTRLDIGSMTADGQAVQDLSCDVEAGGFMAGIGIVGALAGQRAAIAKCGPAGEAARVSFVFKGTSTTNVKVLGASSKAVGTCVAKAMAKVKPSTTGTCTATILTADNDAAKAAAAALSPNKPAEPATPKEAAPAKEAPEDTTTADKAPGEGDETSAELLAIYREDSRWSTFTVAIEGWKINAPKGLKQNSGSVEVEGQKWEFLRIKHPHMYSWVFYHPSAVLTPNGLNGLVTQAVDKGDLLQWSDVAKKDAEGDFPEIIVEKAFAKRIRLVRFFAHGSYGTHFILTVFPIEMPDEIVLSWIKSVTFFAPEKPEAGK